MVRFAVGTLSLECNTFSPAKTDIHYFKDNGYLLLGKEIFDYHRNVRNELAGFWNISRKRNITLVPTCAAWAVPHGTVDRVTYDTVKEEFISRIKRARDIDGVYLSLHGSMVVEGIDDPEGDLLESVRHLIGERPLVITLDLHANVTEKMVRHADIIVGYNSFPHTNTYEVGQKAAELVYRYGRRLKDLRRIFVKIPIITPHERMTLTGDGPMIPIIHEIESVEKEDGVLSLSLFVVNCYADIDELGSGIVGTVTNDRLDYVTDEITQLATTFWKNRESYFDFTLYSTKKAIQRGLKIPSQPILLNESSDNVGAGATGDSTYVLQTLLAMKVKVPCIMTIVDPEGVGAAIKIGVGKEAELRIGAKINTRHSKPIRVKARVKTISDGRYSFQGPVFRGVETSMGRTAVLQIKENILVELTELPVWTIDPEHYRCVGLSPERAKFVLIKSQGSFKASYNQISQNVFYLDTPGISSSNLHGLPFSRINKAALYPFNRRLGYRPNPIIFGRHHPGVGN